MRLATVALLAASVALTASVPSAAEEGTYPYTEPGYGWSPGPPGKVGPTHKLKKPKVQWGFGFSFGTPHWVKPRPVRCRIVYEYQQVWNGWYWDWVEVPVRKCRPPGW
jgi:hypothetical protein